VYRFPYLAGVYGGAFFVLIYLAFLVLFGIPIMSMEFAVGRASQKSVATSFQALQPKGTKWSIFSWFAMAGNYLLMMLYTTISGWMFFYLIYMAKGDFVGLDPDAIGAMFGAHIADPVKSVAGMVAICVIGFAVCGIGLQKGVERITKVMMTCLLVIMVVLAIRSVTLPGAAEGLRFYLLPNLNGIREHGLWNVLYAAMSQAFFTLSIGIGSMAVFGSYIGKERRLFGESLNITILDTSVSIISGLIIFPACFTYGVNPRQGAGLIFVTLPNIFNEMGLGRLWGTLFFVFMLFAVLSTVVAVFENIIAFAIDLTGCSRKKAVIGNLIAILVLALPAALAESFLVNVRIPKLGGIIDIEDFIVSNNLLPLGSLVYLLFCLSKKGWGWENFLREVDAGQGLTFPAKLKIYFKYGLPVIVLAVFVFGYIQKFFMA
jgi:NSS family neurotransmitter:Na+ symporter